MKKLFKVELAGNVTVAANSPQEASELAFKVAVRSPGVLYVAAVEDWTVYSYPKPYGYEPPLADRVFTLEPDITDETPF